MKQNDVSTQITYIVEVIMRLEIHAQVLISHFYFYLQNDAFGAISYTFTAIIMQRVVFCKYYKCAKEILYDC